MNPKTPANFTRGLFNKGENNTLWLQGIRQIEELINESEKIANDVEHVSNQLMKIFDSSTVCESEEKRKLKRAEVKGKEKETNCQNIKTSQA
jgi:hypothetical protein